MQFVKGLLRSLLSLGFKFSLAMLVVVGPLVAVFATSVQLKQSLRSSGLYAQAPAAIVDGIGNDNKQADPNQPRQKSAFDDQAVKDVAKKALTPTFLQSTSEQIIDGMYGWLQEKTAQPQFSIDTSGLKQEFTAAAGDYAISRAKSLPACTLAQTRQLAGQAIDPLKISCVPTGFDINSLPALVSQQLDKQGGENGEKDNIFQFTTINPDNLPKDDSGKTPIQNLTEKASNAPKLFHLLTIAPIILSISAVICGGLFLLLHDDKRRGTRQLAITTLVLGVLSLAGIFLTSIAFNKLEQSDAFMKADADLKAPLLSLAHSLVDAVNSRLMLFGIAYVALGAGVLLVLHFTKPRQQAEHTETTHHTAGEEPTSPVAVHSETPDETADEPKPKKDKKPPKNIIQ